MIYGKLINILVLILACLSFSCHPELKPKGTEIEAVDSLIAAPGSDTSFVSIDTSIIKNMDTTLFKSIRFDALNIFSEDQLIVEKGNYWKANDYIGRPVTLGYTFQAPANDTMRHLHFYT